MDLFFFIGGLLIVGLLVPYFLGMKRRALANSKDESLSSSKIAASKATANFSGKLAIGSTLLAVVFIAVSVTTIVAPRTVGVAVAFGKPTTVYSNGLHFKAPWADVEKLDGAVQNDIYSVNNERPPIEVRLGNDSKASADASIQWQLRTDDAMNVFLDYRTFENIQTNLVDRNFKAAMNEVMASYDPLNNIDNPDGNITLETLSAEVLEKMIEKVGNQIDVKSVTIPIVNFDEATQNRINELQAETARTRIAEQKQETSAAEAQANEALETSLTPEVLISKCLDIVAESGKSPIGCFPSSGVTPITMVGDEAPPAPQE